MRNHDGFVVILEDYKSNYEIYKIEKGLLISPSPGKPRLSPPLT